MKTGVKVSDAMSQSPITVDPDVTIMAATKIMVNERVGSLLITKDQELLGIITEKDVVRAIAKGLDLSDISLQEVMSKRIHTIDPEDDLYDAVHHMKKNKVRRLPVLHRGNLVGMLTVRDILQIQPILYEILYDWGNLRASKSMGEEKNE